MSFFDADQRDRRRETLMSNYYEARTRIIEGGMEVFLEKGPKFTMDDLAKHIGMSKKTIYVVFRDKEALLINMVDYVFDAIKVDEERVLNDESLDTMGRLKGILAAMPDNFAGIDFAQVYSQQDRFPAAYKRMVERLESGWEVTLSVLQQGIDEGIFRPVNMTVFQMVYEASIERFLNGVELEQNNVDYRDALLELVDIMIMGIRK